MSKNIGKNVRGECSQKLLDHAKQSATDSLKNASKKENKNKKTEQTGDLIGYKIAIKITNISKSLQWNNPETVTNEHDKGILMERYISPAEIQKVISNLRLI